jgi:NAD(P)-dependent dehydrogenase (short-subunit alcohol dehydrogenase family)
MDVDRDASVEEGLRRSLSLMGEIHAVVANAGCSIVGPLEELPMDAVRQQVETNLLGVIRVIRGVLPHLRRRGGGTVVVTGSLAGRIPLPFQSVYTATKTALAGLCAALRMETRPFGIRVHLVEPTDIRTPLTDHRKRYLLPGSPYGDRFHRCMHIAERAERKAEGPEVVAEAVVRILERGRGSTRIPVGRGARLMGWIRGVLPDSWAEALIRRHFQV